jgi:hypothetical protein
LKCPNCGNEPINVNGKYVCLDCGIEISPTGAATAPQAATPVLETNHFSSLPASPVQQPAPTFFANPGEKVIAPPPPTSTPSLKDQYMAELQKDDQPQAGGVFDFSAAPAEPAAAPAGNPLPDFPVGSDEPSVPPQSEATQSLPDALSPEITAQPTPAPMAEPTPVNTEFESPIVSIPAMPTPEILPEPFNAEGLQNISQSSTQEEAVEATVMPQEVATTSIPVTTPEPASEPLPVAPEASTPGDSFDPSPMFESVKQPGWGEAEASLAQAVTTPEIPAQTAMPTPEPVAPNPLEVSLPPAPAMGDMVSSEVSEPLAIPVEAEPTPQPIDNPAAPMPIEQPIAPVVPQAEVVPTDSSPQESYFQPSSVDIRPGQEEPASPTPLESTQPPAQDPNPPILPQQEILPTEPPAEAPDINSLLDKYAPPSPTGAAETIDNVRPAQYSSYSAGAENSTEQVNGIPSVQSVFDGEVEDPNIAIAKTAAKNRKIKIVIGLIFGILLLGALAAGAFFMMGQGGSDEVENFEQTLQAGVSAKMDESQNLRVEFRQAADFSKLSVLTTDPEKAETLLGIFTEPYESKGEWQISEGGNISQDNLAGADTFKRIYIEEEKKTYVISEEEWQAEEGRNISNIPLFFNPVERGSLFYETNVDRVSYQKKIPGRDDKSLYEVRIYPKEDFLKDVLKEVAPIFEEALYKEINTENLLILARVDEENILYSVQISGTISVATDFFEGEIGMAGQADYYYEAVLIESPIARAFGRGLAFLGQILKRS